MLRRLLYASLTLVAACSERPDQPSLKATNSKSAGHVDGIVVDDNSVTADLTVVKTTKNGDVFPEDEIGVEKDALVFPRFAFNGQGNTTCNGKTYHTVMQFNTALDEKTLYITAHDANLEVGGKGKGQGQATQKIQENTGVTIYTRSTPDELEALRATGFDAPTFAIFAKHIDKVRQGQSYDFDPPVPVLPMPAAISRYAPLSKADNQVKCWTTSVTGYRNFAMSVCMTLMQASAGRVDILMKTQPSVTGDEFFRTTEDFPMPYESHYVIDTAGLTITRIENKNLFWGDECDGHPEQVLMSYNICSRDPNNGQPAQGFDCSNP